MESRPNTTKAQHFVPQFYLRRFQNDQHVFVFDKTNSRTFLANTSGIAQERYFYDLDFGSESDFEQAVDKQLAERALSEIESIAASVIAQILSEANNRRRIRKNLQRQLAVYIAIQLLRTKTTRENIDQLTRIILNALASELPELSEEGLELRFAEGSVKQMHITTLFNTNMWEKMANILVNHIWILAFPEHGHVFITSDHPIAIQPHIFDEFQSFAGIGSEGVEIAFPLSPTCLLIMKEKEFHSHDRRLNRKSITLTADKVRAYNRLQVKSSNRWLYSQKDDFADCDAYCNLYPELRIEDRQRIFRQ